MSQRFFALSDDVYFPHRWHLATPTDGQGYEVDDWQFSDGKSLLIKGRLRVPIEHVGKPLDFSEAGIKIPVVHIKVATAFLELAPNDVQLIPVDIEGHLDQYLILVATRLIRCIDEKASRVLLWTPEDGEPEKVGQYRDVRSLRLDKSKTGNIQVLRPEGWSGTLIVSGEIKAAMEQIGATGARFEEV
ncbi:imm11 family protein [Hyalangium rubrum]|uniref:Immunity MXAN-0049 protein domain-containing protein n=1 Tax=Hyalangium rubrum TaxID=3103134 RepID=A0ABU5H163_9BACT|nr:DUF1629 domain-containing protein [Hyalangium sp. s54d21]MDY7227192.1 hypothetical protein [Hyalangium sp. s54d21]